MTALSILDLVRITQDTDARGALDNARDVAVHAEAWGYRRIWVAEHHNMPGIASAATSVVIGHIAAGTRSIRVGAGGIMLPNHSPYVIAEQFGTLARLFPGRIDLGLGRAPGTDQMTLRALRRTNEAAENFPQDVLELQALFAPAGPNQRIQAVPAAGTEVPLWILGSSNFGAMLAAELGLPYAFASHFAPELLMPALQIYRGRFKPSEQLDRPYAMVGVNIIAADSDREARRLATTRRARPEPAADRRHRELLVAFREATGDGHARALHHRLPRHSSCGHHGPRSGDRRRRADDRVRCLRSSPPAALLRTDCRRRKHGAVAISGRRGRLNGGGGVAGAASANRRRHRVMARRLASLVRTCIGLHGPASRAMQ